MDLKLRTWMLTVVGIFTCAVILDITKCKSLFSFNFNLAAGGAAAAPDSKYFILINIF
jgi:hypothetical protein